jgi:hypothetical protein
MANPRDDFAMGDIGRQDRYRVTDDDFGTIRQIVLTPEINRERFSAAMAGHAPSQDIIDRRQDPAMGWGEYWYNMMAGEFAKREARKKLSRFDPMAEPVSPLAYDAGYYDVGLPPRGNK